MFGMNREGRREAERSSTITRVFNYNKGKEGEKGFVRLSFSLRIDTKNELEDFLDLLEQASIDVREEIAK